MPKATVARKYIDNGLHEPGTVVEVSERRLAELIRMGLVFDPASDPDPATDAEKKGKK